MDQIRQRLSVLLADDDEDDVYLFKEAVQDFPGLKLRVAQNGQQVLKCLTEGPVPDLIILDINMPQMNGLDCLRSLQSQIKAGTFTVIMFSTSKEQAHIAQAKQLGARAYIKKPMSYSRYWELVKLMVDRDWSVVDDPFTTYL
jgi:CheY-like chemotaxis protein